MIAKLFGEFRAPLHRNGGEAFSPAQVYLSGIAWPSRNATLTSSRSAAGTVVVGDLES
jgi:hypothetical protein